MAFTAPTLQPLNCWKTFLRKTPPPYRLLSTASPTRRSPHRPPSRLLYFQTPSSTPRAPKPPIKTYPPPPSARRRFPQALDAITESHLSKLDPTGSRQRLFSRANPDVPRPGDILLVTFKTGDPFAGVCLSIRRRGVDTGILLRNRLMMTGVEMWVKVFSPNVGSVEVVKRAERRIRRARLFYMRKFKHDRGSVEGVVERYMQQRRLRKGGEVGKRDGKGLLGGTQFGKKKV